MADNFVPSDFVRWQVEYTDGTKRGEADGMKYGGIERSRMKKFQLLSETGEVIFETWPPPGKSGQNFVYRRRTRIMEGGQKMTLFVIGWLLDGPAFAVNVSDGSYRVSETGFIVDDPDMYPPDPMPGETWFNDQRKKGQHL